MRVAHEELIRKGIQPWIEKLLGGRQVNLRIFNAEMIAVDRNS